MSDQTDSGLDALEQDDSQSAVNSEQTNASNAGNSLAGDALADMALNDPAAAERLRRHFQSQKDRGVKNAQQKADEALKTVDSLAKYLNLDPDKLQEAKRNMVLDRLVESQLNSEQVSREEIQPEARPQASSKLTDVFAAFDVDANSQEAAQLAATAGYDATSLAIALGKREQTQRNVSIAAVTQPAGGTSASNLSDTERDRMAGELIELMKEPTKNREKIASLKKKMEDN